MAITTTDLYVRPEDGWKLAATAPATFCMIKPSTAMRWYVAVAADVPGAEVIGVQMGHKNNLTNEFKSEVGIAQNVYVRVPVPQNSEIPYDSGNVEQGGTHFGVIAG